MKNADLSKITLTVIESIRNTEAQDPNLSSLPKICSTKNADGVEVITYGDKEFPQIDGFAMVAISNAPRIAFFNRDDLIVYLTKKTVYWVPRLWDLIKTDEHAKLFLEQANLFARHIARDYIHLRITEIDFMFAQMTTYKIYNRIDLNILHELLGYYLKDRSRILKEYNRQKRSKESTSIPMKYSEFRETESYKNYEKEKNKP